MSELLEAHLHFPRSVGGSDELNNLRDDIFLPVSQEFECCDALVLLGNRLRESLQVRAEWFNELGIIIAVLKFLLNQTTFSLFRL